MIRYAVVTFQVEYQTLYRVYILSEDTRLTKHATETIIYLCSTAIKLSFSD